MEKQKIAKTRNAMLTPRISGTRVVGSTKSGRIPWRGLAAGIVFNTARGMLLMSFGSTVGDMTVTNQILWYN